MFIYSIIVCSLHQKLLLGNTLLLGYAIICKCVRNIILTNDALHHEETELKDYFHLQN